MLYGASNSSNTTGSTYNLVSMLRSISLYRALKKNRFSSTSPNRIFGDFWYVLEDIFLNQKPLNNRREIKKSWEMVKAANTLRSHQL